MIVNDKERGRGGWNVCYLWIGCDTIGGRSYTRFYNVVKVVPAVAVRYFDMLHPTPSHVL